MNQPRRKRWLIDFDVQYSLLRKIAGHWTLFLLANALAMFFWIRLFDNPVGTWSECLAKFLSVYFPVILVSLALLPVFLLDTIKLSNRFSGPIMRVRQAIAMAATGKKIEPIHFRNGDFWKGLASDFNLAFCSDQVAKSDGPTEVLTPNTNIYPES